MPEQSSDSIDPGAGQDQEPRRNRSKIGWVTAASISAIAALLSAIMPVTALIEGCQQRKLEKDITSNTIKKEYLTLALDPQQDVYYKASILDFLSKTLPTDDLMRNWVKEELDNSKKTIATYNQLELLRLEKAQLLEQGRNLPDLEEADEDYIERKTEQELTLRHIRSRVNEINEKELDSIRELNTIRHGAIVGFPDSHEAIELDQPITSSTLFVVKTKSFYKIKNYDLAIQLWKHHSNISVDLVKITDLDGNPILEGRQVGPHQPITTAVNKLGCRFQLEVLHSSILAKSDLVPVLLRTEDLPETTCEIETR